MNAPTPAATTNGHPPVLAAEHLSHTFTDRQGRVQALHDVSFQVARQEFVCLVGPSGSGKSTLLRLLGGLLLPTQGQVIFEGQRLTGPREGMGLVFQKANLMPWRTVLANVMLPLELQGLAPGEARRRSLELIALVGLAGFDHYLPRALSGGMEQRVAIARALVHDPEVLLLDEPFGALDALTRERMGTELLRIWEARKTTVVMVTHSIPEALLLADRVLVLGRSPGQIKLALDVPLQRPRDMSMEYSPTFGALAGAVRQAIEL